MNMNSQQSRILFIAGGAVIIILLIIGFVLSLTSPLKPVRGFIGAVEGQKKMKPSALLKNQLIKQPKMILHFLLMTG